MYAYNDQSPFHSHKHERTFSHTKHLKDFNIATAVFRFFNLLPVVLPLSRMSCLKPARFQSPVCTSVPGNHLPQNVLWMSHFHILLYFTDWVISLDECFYCTGATGPSCCRNPLWHRYRTGFTVFSKSKNFTTMCRN